MTLMSYCFGGVAINAFGKAKTLVGLGVKGYGVVLGAGTALWYAGVCFSPMVCGLWDCSAPAYFEIDGSEYVVSVRSSS